MKRLAQWLWVMALLCTCVTGLWAQQAGGLRGVIYDKDFDVPLALAQIQIVETGDKVDTTSEGNYLISDVAPGNYTLVFSKDGYTRQVMANVVISAGRMTEINVSLAGEFTDMEEFVVQDLELGGASELGMLNLRMDSPALMSGVSSEIISQAGASDAASALRLVSGATVQDGKYAVVRGLPDRYVNSQLNGFRLPTADADKRAVQLDQFPSAMLESIQVSKTFTPNQQGDASGGAVNVVTKGIPEDKTFKFSSQVGYNSQTTGSSDFLTYDGGGVDFWGMDDGSRDIQYNNLGDNWDGAVGVSRDNAPIDYKWSISGGDKKNLDNGWQIGGFGSFFYERDSSYYENGTDDKYWVDEWSDGMTPQVSGIVGDGEDYRTSLFDIDQGSQEVKWGGLASLGLETERNKLSLLYMYTRSTQDKATLAEDTRGKAYYFPGYDKDDPDSDGNGSSQLGEAPYLRLQTLEYTERTTQSFQLSGNHSLPSPNWSLGSWFNLLEPEIDWGAALSSSTLYQPDKRQFGSVWVPASTKTLSGGQVVTDEAKYSSYKAAANFNLGNLQRIWKDISEESQQIYLNFKQAFEQWSGKEGYLKLGLFHDQVDREYLQESFSNFGDNPHYFGDWDSYWSNVFMDEDHAITASEFDVDYEGEQTISAGYGMLDLPLNDSVNLIGGLRYERTELNVINHPEANAKWIPISTGISTDLNPGDADVAFSQNDLLPSLGLTYEITDQWTAKASYSQTVARQTFKELTPIQQMEYLGGDVFIGNPELEMSDIQNYDLRVDYNPYEGGLISLSYFYKQINKPIEYVQRVEEYIYTRSTNYPDGTLEGWELEIRQDIGHFKESLAGLTVGTNFTLIDSEVTLPTREAEQLANLGAPMTKREMTGAPEHLFNLFFTYDLTELGLDGTKVGLFYTIRGDTLTSGAGQSGGNFIPNVYAKQYDTLNFSLTQKLSDRWKMKFQAKNLTDPAIQTVYRSEYTSGDQVKTSYKKGIDLSLSMSYEF